MKKTVLTFGLIISVRMVGSLFLLIYFGIRSYRDNTLGLILMCVAGYYRKTRTKPPGGGWDEL